MSDGFDLVIGLGVSGQSCLRYLVAQGESVRAMDSRAELPGLDQLRQSFPDVAIHVGGFREDWIEDSRRLIISPGVAVSTPEVARASAAGKEVIGDVELFARAASLPVAAVTGSNAKSTVTAMLAEVARQCGRQPLAGGNLGTPALDLLGAPGDLYVLELSSFQLETTWSLDAQVSVILNISEDHMDRYANFYDYIAAKQRIYDGSEVVVWNRDDELTRPQRPPAREITFGLHAEADYHLDAARGMLMCRGEDLLPVSQLTLKGIHNALNVLAVLAMSEALGLDRASAVTAAAGFAGLPHRCQLVAEDRGISWFNDSKGTNVGATLAALAGIGPAIAGKIVLIAGGQGKGQDFELLGESAQRYARAAVLIGEDAKRLAKAIEPVECHFAQDMADAVRRASLLAEPGDAVLLSPACASMDMFRNYSDRGDTFVECVKEVARGA